MSQHITEAGTFLDRLRTTTAQSHTDLEKLPISLSITNPAVTDKEYLDYLLLMHDVVKDAEENIFPVLSNIIPDLQERNKAYHIERDLDTLGSSKTTYAKVLSTYALTQQQPFALGVMYVIEGSSLGGRFILKNISEALGHTAQEGASYFAGYGNNTGSRWKAFLNIVTQYAEEKNCEEEIIAGANFAFDAIKKHFTENTPL